MNEVRVRLSKLATLISTQIRKVPIALVLKALSIVAIVASCGSMLFSLWVVHVSPYRVLLFAYLLICYLLLPGYFFARLFANRNKPTQLISYSLVFSMAILVLTYFLDELVLPSILGGYQSLCEFAASLNMPLVGADIQRGAVLEALCSPILSVAGLASLVMDLRRHEFNRDAWRPDVHVIAIICVSSAVAFFTLYMCVSVPVNKIRFTGTYYDVLWLISNDASLAHGWPADGFQYMGKRLNSNILANVLRASLSRVTGISSAEMFGICTTFISVPTVLLSVHALAESWFKDSKKAAFCLFTFAFVSYFSLAFLHLYNINRAVKQVARSYFFSIMINIFYCPNGIDLAVPLVCTLVQQILDLYKQKRMRIATLISIIVLSALCTGAKFVFTICVIAAIVGTIVLCVIRGDGLRRQTRPFICAALIAISFCAVYFTVVRGGEIYMEPTKAEPVYSDTTNVESYTSDDYVYEGEYSSVLFGASVMSSKLYTDVKHVLVVPKGGNELLAFALIPVHFVLQQLVVSIPFVLWIVSRIKKFKDVGIDEMLIAGIAVCGIIIYYLINIDGLSQTYFFFIASIMINMVGAGWLWDNYKSLNRVCRMAVCVAMAIALTSTYIRVSENRVTKGLHALESAIHKETMAPATSNYNRFTDKEYEAMVWIRDNTPTDAVIAVDRHYNMKVELTDDELELKKLIARKKGEDEETIRRVPIPEPNQKAARYYYYTAFGERQTYLGAWSYMPRTAEAQQQIVKRLQVNDALYNEDCTNRRELMESNGISYIVVSRFVNPDLDLSNEFLKEVYKNEAVSVYELS